MKRFALAALIALASCTPPAVEDAGTHVVAAFYPIAEAAERVGGEDVHVTNLTPPGAEPHDLELTPQQVDTVTDADFVFYLGGGFQPALEDVLEQAKGEVVDVGDDLVVGGDPHIWLDPVRQQRVAERIATSLFGDPVPYARTLDALDEDMTEGLDDCERDLLVTSHAAFSYLAKRYGLRQEAISGVSPEAEPDPRRLAEIADLVRDEGVTTLFTETLVSPKVAQTLAREAGVRVGTLDPIEGLTEEQIENGDDYTTVMRRNLAALRRGLDCD